MVRHKMTLREQLEGVKKALRSPKTPPQFRPALELRKRELEGKIERGQK